MNIKKNIRMLFTLAILPIMFILFSVNSFAKDSEEIYDKYYKDVKEASGKDFKYKKNKDGTITITRYLKKDNLESFKIPEYIDGKKVTAIGSGKQYDFVGLRGKVIVIPDTVEVINYDSLGDWDYGAQFETLLIGKNVDQISDLNIHSDMVFKGAFRVKSIYVNPKNDKYYSEDGVLYLKKKGGDMLLTYPNGRKNESFVIPDSVRGIIAGSFGSAKYLKKLVLGKKVQYLSLGIFGDDIREYDTGLNFSNMGLRKLEAIEVAKGNKYLYSKNGVLFEKKGKALVAYPRGRTNEKYVIPKGTKRIKSEAFYENPFLSKLIIPDTLTRIDDSAVSFCSKLKKLTIPKTVKKLKGAFMSSGIEKFYVYEGSAGEKYAKAFCKKNSNEFKEYKYKIIGE